MFCVGLIDQSNYHQQYPKVTKDTGLYDSKSQVRKLVTSLSSHGMKRMQDNSEKSRKEYKEMLGIINVYDYTQLMSLLKKNETQRSEYVEVSDLYAKNVGYIYKVCTKYLYDLEGRSKNMFTSLYR